MERSTFVNRHPWPLFGLGLLLGCAMSDPGGQTATALRQRFLFGWDESGTFKSEGDGSQTGAFTMIEGSLVIGTDGQPDLSASHITSYLSYTPRADDAATAFQAALSASTEQVRATNQTLQSVLTILAPRLLPQVFSPDPVDSP